jgi:hypothetical protein
MAALVAIGRGAEARELSQHHRQAEPKFSLVEFQKRVGVRDPDIRHQYIDHLRLAGVESYYFQQFDVALMAACFDPPDQFQDRGMLWSFFQVPTAI